MKKTLMVLTFALCASLTFAQMATPNHRGQQVKAANNAAMIENTFNSSIFTKDAGDTLKAVDFHAANVNYTTGVVTSGADAHSMNYPFATWRRITGLTDADLTPLADIYPSLVSVFGGNEGVAGFCETMRTSIMSQSITGDNGFVMLVPYEQNTPNSGNINAFIKIDSINTTTAPTVDVRFYQHYRKYYDECYIDYSTNGTSWSSVEINVEGVDVNVNTTVRGFFTYSLPIATAGQPNLSIRIRWFMPDDHRGNAYGFWWIIDDIAVLAGPADRVRQFDDYYVEGNYGLVPQGMKINPAWYTLVENNGANVRNNVTASLNHLNAAQDTETPIVEYNNQSIPVSATKGIIVDKHGWIYADSMDYRGWYAYGFIPHGTGSDLPTGTVGDNYIFAKVESGDVNLTYDTMYYNVTPQTDGYYRWGHDNGVLTYYPSNHWLYGFVYSGGGWYITEDAEDVQYYKAGYMINTRYTTDDVIPEGWVIRGVELVASPVRNFYNTGSRISAVLWTDEYDGSSVGFNTVITGANPKEITAADVNDSTIIGRNSNGYRELGQYNTVIIPFPEQPALTPNTSYRVGYSIEEDSYFAVAREATGTYRVASPTRPDTYDTVISFASNEATAKYAHYYYPNTYQSYFYDPSYGGQGRPSGFANYSENNPMIRLLVGPAQAVNRVNINVECEETDYGSVVYAGNEVCGTTLTPAEGSSVVLSGVGSSGCGVMHLFIDGEEVFPYDEETEEGDPHLTMYYDQEENSYTWQYQFVNLQADHTVHFVFGELVSIDPVASNVTMKLQPNPATSQVSLNIEGVNGMVNCSIIDMSGRVVYNQSINAENANVINLNSLAKGAYFVRITNEQFSKVEKLIVR